MPKSVLTSKALPSLVSISHPELVLKSKLVIGYPVPDMNDDSKYFKSALLSAYLEHGARKEKLNCTWRIGQKVPPFAVIGSVTEIDRCRILVLKLFAFAILIPFGQCIRARKGYLPLNQYSLMGPSTSLSSLNSLCGTELFHVKVPSSFCMVPAPCMKFPSWKGPFLSTINVLKKVQYPILDLFILNSRLGPCSLLSLHGHSFPQPRDSYD
ncbi:hypothetical protein VNO77_37684 [Canavalia gladiata]|uniref:Uncharacterized protein n=1 Tax=Canavalia gladiata TaxID=3824 RepID=A0AAN9PX91_CANGL